MAVAAIVSVDVIITVPFVVLFIIHNDITIVEDQTRTSDKNVSGGGVGGGEVCGKLILASNQIT